MQSPPSHYGPPPSHSAYGPSPAHGAAPALGPPGARPPKKPMGVAMILLVVCACCFGTCLVAGVVASANKSSSSASPAANTATSAPIDPAAAAAKAAADKQAAQAAADAKEKNAVDTFPTKKSALTTALAKAKSEAAVNKWEKADTDARDLDAQLNDFRGTTIAATKDFQDLDTKTTALRARIDPQMEKIAQAAASAAAEKELKANSTSVTSSQLFEDYQANEVAADARYKGRKLLVTGSVASIDRGAFGGLHLRLNTPNEFMSTMCSMEDSEKSSMSQLSKGENVRVLCDGMGMVLGSPSLDNCVFR